MFYDLLYDYDTLVYIRSGLRAGTILLVFKITWFATYSIKNNYRGYLKTQ